MIAATTGAKIATSTMRPITLSEIIDALSCSSRCVASRHGLRPSIFFAAGGSSAPARERRSRLGLLGSLRNVQSHDVTSFCRLRRCRAARTR